MPVQTFPYLRGGRVAAIRFHSPRGRPPFAGVPTFDSACSLRSWSRRCVGSLVTNGGIVSDLDDIARELDQRALQVEAAGAQLMTAAANALWTSIAADAFRSRVDDRNRECARLADVLRTAGRTVRSFSDAVSAEKARLRRLELAAEHVVSVVTRVVRL
jgi:uncharacterized protein YukE